MCPEVLSTRNAVGTSTSDRGDGALYMYSIPSFLPAKHLKPVTSRAQPQQRRTYFMVYSGGKLDMICCYRRCS
jgi:hypothetical protein